MNEPKANESGLADARSAASVKRKAITHLGDGDIREEPFLYMYFKCNFKDATNVLTSFKSSLVIGQRSL
jgi:hypothetical protein